MGGFQGSSGGGGDVTLSVVRVTKTSNQVTITAIDTIISWDSESFDTEDYHDNVADNGRFTIPKTGHYSLKCTLQWPGNANGFRTVGFSVNGGATQPIVSVGGGDGTSDVYTNGTIDLFLNVGDFIRIMGRQTTGSNLSIQSAGSFMSLKFLGI